MGEFLKRNKCPRTECKLRIVKFAMALDNKNHITYVSSDSSSSHNINIPNFIGDICDLWLRVFNTNLAVDASIMRGVPCQSRVR